MMYSKWINLSLETRNKIADAFDIIKKGSIEVFSNTIRSDGYLVADIENAITVSSMQSYLGSKVTDSNVLFDMLVAKFEGKPEVTATPEPEKVVATGTFEGKIEVMPKEDVKKVVKKKVIKVVKKVAKKNAKKK